MPPLLFRHFLLRPSAAASRIRRRPSALNLARLLGMGSRRSVQRPSVGRCADAAQRFDSGAGLIEDGGLSLDCLGTVRQFLHAVYAEPTIVRKMLLRVWLQNTARRCASIGRTKLLGFPVLLQPTTLRGLSAGHGERSRSQLYYKRGGTENLSVWAVYALVVNVLAVNSVSEGGSHTVLRSCAVLCRFRGFLVRFHTQPRSLAVLFEVSGVLRPPGVFRNRSRSLLY